MKRVPGPDLESPSSSAFVNTDEAFGELEAERGLKKVATCEWAAPIVSSVKKDGSVRVSGDFKVTINPVIGQ